MTLSLGNPQPRMEALERLHALLPSSYTGFSDVVEREGIAHYGELRGVGDQDVSRHWCHFDGTPSLAPWDPRAPKAEDRDVFRRGRPPSAPEARRAWDVLYHPVGLRDTWRMLVYDDVRFVGYFAVHRFADEAPFTRQEVRTIRSQARAARNLLVAADRLSRPEGTLRGNLLCDAEGRVLSACATGRAWATRARRERIARRLRHAPDGWFLVDGALLEPVRLEGDGFSQFLLLLTPARRPCVSPLSRLTVTQREVADLAAVGATVDQIANHLERRPSTVRSHLKTIYARLGVSSRVELSRLVRAH